jgi:peptidoglycan/LPS O-acetylase OafA/YrhL
MQQYLMRFLWLDGLRGIAAWYVLLFHFFGSANIFTGFGWLAVDFFFVLSGFVLCKTITLAGGKGVAGFKAFIRKRMLRLFPMLSLALFLRFLVQLCEYIIEFFRGSEGNAPAFYITDPISYILSIFLIQFLFPFSIFLLLPLWSLSVEFYSNLLQLILRLTGSLRGIFLSILIGIALIAISGIYIDSGPDWGQYNTWIFAFGRAFAGFNVGQIMWILQQKWVGLNWKNSLFFTLIGTLLSVTIWVFVKELFLVSVYFSFGFLVLVFSKFNRPASNSKVSRILSALGATSYPIYLFHIIILSFFARFSTGFSLVDFFFFYLLNLTIALFVLKYLEPKVKVFLARYIAV